MKKHGGGGPARERSRPSIKSSHEKVLDGVARKARAKTPRRMTRAPAEVAGPRARPHTPVSAGVPSKPDAVVRRARLPRKARLSAPLDDDATGAWSVASESARERATAIAVAALDKKAVGVEILDVAGKVDYADFLVIMTGRSDRHAQALAQGIEEALKKRGVRPMAVEGLPNGSWVLIDFGDVVVHVFQNETRQLYDIEGLWLDARRLPVPPGVTTE
jgi:ribosome-associated protein